jgi:DNA-directed RNA polymerase specialized sigma24 family protein
MPTTLSASRTEALTGAPFLVIPATQGRRTMSEPPTQPDRARDFDREREFLLNRVRVMARGRVPGDQEDIAADAWIRFDRAVRREGARNEEALMTSIAWRTWVDFCRKEASARRALGERVPVEDEPIGAPEVEPGVDPERLAIWRFAVCQWFAQHQPRCVEAARQFFSERDWVEIAGKTGERPNSLAKRWQRCKDLFVDMVRADRGSLRDILDYFEGATT